MKIKSHFLILVLFFSSTLLAQNGVIKGRVVDQQSNQSLIGCNVIVLNTDPILGASTDVDGYFRIVGVPVGRQSITVSYLGYEPQVLPNIVVTAGKETVLDIGLQESFSRLDEVVISSGTSKDQAVNEMATLSARQFSLEEVRRFSGSGTDVARMVANFAGVSSNDDNRNDIVVRGNSPTGVLWRLEGLAIPSPNHFSTVGTTGGPISAVNPNVLKNSDFLTSAFPAEYGNALAASFDLGLRSGNRDKGEYSFQAGAFSGLEMTAEGPLKKGQSSYLIAGRYSLVGLISGAAGTNASPIYSDVAFKVDLGMTKIGRFEFFGMGGPSNIEFIGAELDSTDVFAETDENSRYDGGIYVAGMTHTLLIGEQSYLKTTIGGARSQNTFSTEKDHPTIPDYEEKIRYLDVSNEVNTLSIHTRFNSKLSKRSTIKAGLHGQSSEALSTLSNRENNPDTDGDGIPDSIEYYRIDGRTAILEPYAQFLYRLSEKVKFNMGVHGQYHQLNEQMVVEPRLGASYSLNKQSELSIGYGLHHQAAPMPILFLKHITDQGFESRNEDLDLIRAQHFVLAYDLRFGADWRAKVEAYYQAMDKVPVDALPSFYSTLVEGADFGFSTDHTDLRNGGTATNLGLEITLEKFFSKNYYSLITASFFDAKYVGSDNIERNSPFNNGYVVNVLAGKEFPLDAKQRRLIFMDTKLSVAGGNYYSPIDLEASTSAGRAILEEGKWFSEQYDDYFRWDVKLGMRLNSQKKNVTHRFYLDFLNVLNTQNIFNVSYSDQSESLRTTYQRGFFPDFGYRVEF